MFAIRQVRITVAAAGCTPALRISEIRTVGADTSWLSPLYQRASAAFHFTWVPDAEAVRDAVELVERALAPFEARPHWGKVFAAAPGRLYPRWDDFRVLAPPPPTRGASSATRGWTASSADCDMTW
ncbi:hypothetical protein UK23_27775 [Lentzea aerocolonigenes]|uniref:D-arabinono-1,4-lactone oxidase C-terminal domain-containing protein n=1 Tax=Lentzea aerocolonigenes TaxID=68170 RepID=A0A0F0GNC9_LENAE|nr:D-arabinono-1,4-lactone oxidase [Lentzea aerocolonigenes]KJK44984.1 hypothetical protein UK23_27775 [Lentzea aerocolonigenes]